MYVAFLKENGNSITNRWQRSVVLAIHVVCDFVMESRQLELGRQQCCLSGDSCLARH